MAIPAIGNPVAFVNTPDAGVPNVGVEKVGDVNVLLVNVCDVDKSTVTAVSIAIVFPVFVIPVPPTRSPTPENCEKVNTVVPTVIGSSVVNTNH